MKRFHTHVSTMQTALQQRPEVLKAVSVYATINVLNGVVYNLMQELVMQSLVSAHLVGIERGSSLDMLTNDRLQGFFLPICDDLSANLAATLQGSHDDSLVSETLTHASDAPSVNILVHVPGLATDKSFVGFNFAAKLASEVFILHSEPDAMQHEPCSLLGDLQIALNFPTTDSVFAIGDEPDCSQPLVKADGRIFADGSDLDGEFALEVMSRTCPSPTCSIECTHFFGTADWASDNPVRPALGGEIINAIIGIREVQDCFLQALGFGHKCLTHKKIIAQNRGRVKLIIALGCYYYVPKWERAAVKER